MANTCLRHTRNGAAGDGPCYSRTSASGQRLGNAHGFGLPASPPNSWKRWPESNGRPAGYEPADLPLIYTAGMGCAVLLLRAGRLDGSRALLPLRADPLEAPEMKKPPPCKGSALPDGAKRAWGWLRHRGATRNCTGV